MNSKKHIQWLSLLIVFLVTFGFGQSAWAATVTATSSGAWSAAIWSPSAPGPSDDVIIPDGLTVTIGADAEAKSITLNGNATLTIGAFTLDVAASGVGGITLNGTSTLTLGNTAILKIGTTTYQGDIVMNDNSVLTIAAASDIYLSGTWTKSADATITTTADPSLFLIGITNVTLPVGLTELNTLTVTKVSGTATLSDNLALAANIDIVSGTLVVGNNNLTVTTTTEIDAGATLNGSATESVIRTFGTGITNNGTLNVSGGQVSNTFTLAYPIAASTGTLNINYSTSSFASTVGADGTQTINALGSTVTFTGLVTFTGITLNTNNNTNLTFSAAQSTAAANYLPAMTLNNLTFTAANSKTFAGNITVYGNCTISAGTLVLGGYTLTVYGVYNATGGTITATTANDKLVLYGPVDEDINSATPPVVGTWGTFTTSANTSIEILGSGVLPVTLPAATVAIGNITMNRPGVNLEFAATMAMSTLTITSGTVTLDGGTVATVSGATSIGVNGTLVANGATSVTFSGAVSGTGTIDADATDAIIFSVVPTYTGTLLTDANTTLTYSLGGSLPSSVSNVLAIVLTTGTLTFNSDVTIVTAVAVAHLAANASVFDVNGYTLTLTNGIAAAAVGGITLTENSTLISTATADFTGIAARLLTDETTNLTFNAAVTAFPTAVTELNNLTITGAGVLAQTASMTIYGNLSANSSAVAFSTAGAFTLTVYGDVTAVTAGDITLASTGIVKLYGQMEGIGVVSSATTLLEIAGTGSQFIMPYQVVTLGRLTLNRATGMKLNAALTVGLAAGATTDLVITKGDLDLNGYTITLAQVDTYISETAGNTVINTGASGVSNGYITTAATADGNIELSGIGITALDAGTDWIVRRYPKTVPVPSIGLSTSRIFRISNTANDEVTLNITLVFDNTELNSSASDLKLYTNTTNNDAFPVYTEFKNASPHASSVISITENSPSSGKGTFAYSSTSNMFDLASTTGNVVWIALAAVPGDGGVMRTFAGTSGNWGDDASWTPAGVPSKIDQVVIGPATVYLNGNGAVYEAKTLYLNHANATLLPTDNGVNGDLVTLRVMGNLNLAAGAELKGINGNGRINLAIGDGTTTGVSSLITVNNDYVDGSGLWVNDFTVNTADITTNANRLRISGDVTLISNSAVTLSSVEFWGGNGSQTISLPSSSNLSMQTVRLDNSAIVGTTSDLTITSQFTVISGSTYNANGGNTLFTTPSATDGDPWLVESGATLKLFNVEFNSTSGNAFTPLGTAYIQGDFYQYNTADFAPTSGTVIFSNSSQKQIVNTQATGDLKFYNIEVSPNSQVVTSNDWTVQKQIDVKTGASLKADNGTITMNGTAPLYIKNASTQTLEFNNLTLTTTTYTSDSWTIKGNLTTTASLIADKGTITFSNIQQKTITTNALTPPTTFFKILVADGSKVITVDGGAGNFTISNNSTNPTGAGIEVAGTGQFTVGDEDDVITFDAGVGVAAGYPKVITKSSAGTLKFGLLKIEATPNNEVSTASDFEITAVGASAFNNTGAGGKFTATAGTVTFSGTTPEIRSVSPAVTQFYSLATKGATNLTLPVVSAAITVQEFYVAGNITMNDQSYVSAANFADTKIIFNGSTIQTIGGNTSATTPIVIPDFVLNKSNNSELVLAVNTVFGEVNTLTDDELTLVNGILNLGSKSLTVYSDVISRQNGVINGATGTYIINTNHQTPKLEDNYFTVNGTPTLYNLQVNVANTTANDLTVNGTLNLFGNVSFTIGSGASASAPVKLILNGNLTRTSGEIGGTPATEFSRLVLQGTGTVDGGLSNTYFAGAAATTVQLEVARQETLGGNLTMTTASFLRINTGVNSFDLGTYTLSLPSTSYLTMISGGIDADAGTVSLGNGVTTIPPTMFRNNTVKNLTIANATTLGGDLTITGTLTGVVNITTNDNTLTFGPNATLPTFTNAAHVVGNLRRYVTNTATVYNIGNGASTDYVPVTLQFANATSSQAVKISRTFVNPTLSRGGSATDAVSVLWTITPEGTDVSDSLKMILSWPSDVEDGTSAIANASFPAKWNVSSWLDYRNNVNAFAVATPRVLTMSGYKLANPAALKGEWAVFNAQSATDAAKDAAIKVNGNKVVISNITPTPIPLGSGFSATVQLQDYLGQPITASSAFSYTISIEQGVATGAFNGGSNFVGVIPVGQSYTTVSGLSFTAAASNSQFKVDTTGSSANWTATSSELFDVVPVAPTAQATAIQFTNVAATSMTIGWSEGVAGSELVLIKADTLLTASEYPVNGQVYYPNTILGAGSSIGNANVIYAGAAQSVNVTGLSPNTTYYVYVFAYNVTTGAYTYRTTAAAGNPKSQMTTGSVDDDLVLGTNNTIATSKAIGTNTPLKGTIKTADDVDWFNFTITNGSPNLRGQLTLSASLGNYNIEIYNVDGRRLRRGTLLSYSNESQIVNDLPAGTYLVKIMGVDGAFDATNYYTLKLKTSNTEIYSVTE